MIYFQKELSSKGIMKAPDNPCWITFHQVGLHHTNEITKSWLEHTCRRERRASGSLLHRVKNSCSVPPPVEWVKWTRHLVFFHIVNVDIFNSLCRQNIICDCIFSNIIDDCILNFILIGCIFDYIMSDCILDHIIPNCILDWIFDYIKIWLYQR